MRTKVSTVAVAAALLLTACTSGSGDPGVASAGGPATPHASPTLSRFDQFVRYTQCMREQGVPMTDPRQDSTGVYSPHVEQGFDKGKADAAQEVCKSLLPPQETGPQMQAKMELARQFAICMRAHGVENYPDPDAEGRTRVSAEVGNDPQNPDATQICTAERDKAAASLRPSP
jgi:hypothetical protein